MAAGKKELEGKSPEISGTGHSLREDAEEQLARSPKPSPASPGQTPESLIQELQVHQIELEIQAEELRKSKLALEDSRDKYLDLYDFAPLGYFSLTDKGLISGVNLTGATLLGVERGRLVNARFSKFVADKDTDEWHWYFVNVLNQKEKRTCTLMLKRRGGPMFPAQLEAILTTGNDGVNTVRIAIIDITERRLKEEALRESEEKYHNIFRNSLLGIFHSNFEGKFIDVNPALAKMLGYNSPEEAVLSITDIAGQIYVEPPLRDNVAATALAAGGTISVENHYRRRDGTRWYGMLHLRIVPEQQGRPGHYEGFVEDITERKRAEVALRESEKLLSEVFDNANDAIYLLERTPEGPGKYLLVNDKSVQMLGYSRDELLEMSPRDIVPGDIAKKIMPDVIQKLLKDGHATFESAHRRKDGGIYPIEVSTHTFRYKGKDVDLSLVRDITERKRSEEAIRQANKKLTLLSGITRHDINNQLMSLNGFLSLLHRKAPDPILEDYFTRITNASSRIAAMIQFTKEYEEIGVKAPTWQGCRNLVDTAAKQAQLGQVMVKNDLPPGAEVFADLLMVKVFYNLLDNAVRYGGKITTIWFSVKERGGDQILICEDDGEGVVADEKVKIFERGFGKNTGMGLALSREILDITGIAIKETGEPGKGARFEMTVPGGMWRQTGVQ